MSTIDSIPSDFQADLSLAVSLGKKLAELHEMNRQHLDPERQESLFVQIQTLSERYCALIEHLMNDHESEMAARVEERFTRELTIQSTIDVRRQFHPRFVTQADTGVREDPTQSLV